MQTFSVHAESGLSNVVSTSLLKSPSHLVTQNTVANFVLKPIFGQPSNYNSVGLSSEVWQVTAQLLLEAIKGISHAEPSRGKQS